MRSIIIPSSVLALVCTAAAHPQARPDLNSFVNHKITTTQSLVSQVKSDPEVADRYQRHFAMTRPQLVSYLGDLHRGTLSESRMYTIYSVPQDGHVKMHIGKLEKGSAVFMNRSGETILVAKCGNPVVLGPVRVTSRNPLGHDMDDTNARQLPLGDLAMGQLVDGPDNLLAVVPETPETFKEDLPGKDIRGGSVLFPPGAPGGSFPFAAVGAGLASLGAVDLSFNGGRGVNAVPEPATVAALGLGAVALVRRRRRKA